MIQLKRPPKPTELTDEKVRELTEKYEADNNKSVWKQTYIENALLKMSHEKCCFCECNVTKESKYMEVEHFYPKSKYPKKVVEWENLFPICGRCNKSKSDLDPSVTAIIHPVLDNPTVHLRMKGYRLYGKTAIGNQTINEIDLNDHARLGICRFEIGNIMLQNLKDVFDDLQENIENQTLTDTKSRRIRRKLEKLMREGLPEEIYSATIATCILEDENYQNIKEKFKAKNIWDSALTELEQSLEKIALLV